MPRESYDAIVVGSGPNGLAAAIELTRAGAQVLVVEGQPTLGGGTRTAELTLPGFRHDVCSACHPTGILSPLFRQLPLEEHGLTWLSSSVSVAHPLDDAPAVTLVRSVEQTAAGLGVDEAAYRRLVTPHLGDLHGLLADALAPLGPPRHPLRLARFGLQAWRSADQLVRAHFSGERAAALVAGCAGHAVQPLDNPLTAAMTLVFLLTAHEADWPVAAGGSQAITTALAGYFTTLGGEVRTDCWVETLADLPPARVVLLDTAPAALAKLGSPYLPARYVRRLQGYRYGPGSFKVDWALDGPIPWTDPAVGEAATVHLGGTFREIAHAEAQAFRGEVPEHPYVLLVQQSALDPSRAPAGKHTGYAYCHVPAGCTVDMTGAIEAQVERFAPGFGERILARHRTSPADFEQYNPNYLGGAVTGGVADWRQLFTRPVARLDPYSTPNPRLYLCSAATPPGGGVHGMCGFHAARSALRALAGLAPARFSSSP